MLHRSAKIMKRPIEGASFLVYSSEKSFSLLYNEIARKFFIALAFARRIVGMFIWYPTYSFILYHPDDKYFSYCLFIL